MKKKGAQLGNKNRLTHGKSYDKVYFCWQSMKQRCYDENVDSYHRYGGRGIKVCDRWLESFENFYKDMGDPPTNNHSIDRIDNDGNYEPNNCRWSSKYEQSINREVVDNDLIGKKFHKLTVIDHCYGLGWKCICDCDSKKITFHGSYKLKNGLSKSCGCLNAKFGYSNVEDRNILGQKFGMLTVVELISGKGSKRLWKCKCDCGGENIVVEQSLINPKGARSCCKSKKNRFQKGPKIDLTGKVFNKWKVIKYIENEKRGSFWLCECVCGNEKVLRSDRLTRSESKSCGCSYKRKKS